jgi:hypothetical protein
MSRDLSQLDQRTAPPGPMSALGGSGRAAPKEEVRVWTHLRHLTASHVAVAMQQVFASFPPRLRALHRSMNMALQILN